MIKAIFFDIDGTLLSHTTRSVPYSTQIALQHLKEKGIYTFIATGRHISEMVDLPIHSHDIHNILKLIDKHPFPCIFVEKELMYINYHNDAVQIVQDAISTPLPDIQDINRAYSHPIYQVIPYDITSQKENIILDIMPHCQKTRWHELAIDIIPKTGGKQNGIREVLKHYDIQPEETMAFGDGHNDIDMFEFVGLSIAMGNATQELKEVASDVTDDIDHDGIYNALVKYNILQKD